MRFDALLNTSRHLETCFQKTYFLDILKIMFLMVWKYAQMHQNTFFTTPDGKNQVF
jgi:hypothetical protein